MSVSTNPYTLPATTHSYLERAAESLREAITTSEVPARYAFAHVAALRAAAALLAARAAPTTTPRRRGQKNAWVLLAEVAPELSEWAAFFASGASKRAAAEAGSVRAVSEREADDLVREADRFLAVVEQALGLAPHVPFEQQFPWRGGAAHQVGRGGAAHQVGRGGAAHQVGRGGAVGSARSA